MPGRPEGGRTKIVKPYSARIVLSVERLLMDEGIEKAEQIAKEICLKIQQV